MLDQNIKQRGNLIKLNFEGIDMQNWNIPTDRAQRSGERAQRAQMSMSNWPNSYPVSYTDTWNGLY